MRVCTVSSTVADLGDAAPNLRLRDVGENRRFWINSLLFSSSAGSERTGREHTLRFFTNGARSMSQIVFLSRRNYYN